MSACICIFENELEYVASKLDNNKFKYKFMFDSEEKRRTIEYYKLNLLKDCLLFSESIYSMRANRLKTTGKEAEQAWRGVIDDIFTDDRHVAIANDYVDNPYMVLVFPIVFHDISQRKGLTDMTLSLDILNIMIDRFIYCIRMHEGIKVIKFEEYTSDIYQESDFDRQSFFIRQKQIKEDDDNKFRNEVLNTFKDSFKYRMITYYTKLREFGLDDIMRKLNELGYLDERFDNELYLYEEEARRLLAKRLCAISFKNDIEILMAEGLIKPESISYNLNV
jgi:hypothetical protein